MTSDKTHLGLVFSQNKDLCSQSHELALHKHLKINKAWTTMLPSDTIFVFLILFVLKTASQNPAGDMILMQWSIYLLLF